MLGINASAETHAYSETMVWGIWAAYFIGILSVIMGIIFGIIKHEATHEGK